MDLDLDVSEKNGVAVLAVKGEVDVYTAPRLREKLVELVTQGKHRIVGALDGAGLRDLHVFAGARARRRGGVTVTPPYTEPPTRVPSPDGRHRRMP